MTILFLSLIDPPPEGFRFQSVGKSDLLRHPVAILAPDLQSMQTILGDRLAQMAGVIVMPSDRLRCSRHSDSLWVLEAPTEVQEQLQPLLLPLLSTLSEKIELTDQLKLQTQKSDKARSQIEILQSDYQIAATRLMNRVSSLAQAREEIAVLNIGLEDRVKARTQELEAANASLELSKTAAESANLAKSRFLTTMSHEIRTPMNGMIGLIELIADTGLTQTQTAMLHIIKQSAQSLLNTLSDVVEYASMDSAETDLQYSPFAIRQLVSQTMDSLGPIAAASHVQLQSSIAEEVPAVLISDTAKLRQILLCLLSNAIKFSRPDSQVENLVKLRVTSAEDNVDRVRLLIDVEDNGIGISKEAQRHLYEPFTRSEESSQLCVGGSGLGLSICKRLVDQLGGTIRADSQSGVGSTFSVNLPFSVQKERRTTMSAEDAARLVDDHVNGANNQFADDTEKPPQMPAAELLFDANVLVAEDNKINQMVLKKQLTKLGIDSEIADNGKIAFEMWQQGNFDLILTDCQMPVMDGYDFTRALRETETRRETETSSRIPVIAITANAVKGDREKCLQAGMDDYLAKPVDLQMLGNMLKNWLGDHVKKLNTENLK